MFEIIDHRKQTGVWMGGTGGPVQVNGMPCSVLEVLVDFMAGDVRDFFRVAFRLPDDSESNPARAHDTRQDLCSMGLVHSRVNGCFVDGSFSGLLLQCVISC